jgi:hypothetical protein
MEACKEAVVTNALQLVLEHGVPEKQVHDWVKLALLEAVHDLPPLRVAYNTCYGGFSLSSHFSDFQKSLLVQKPVNCAPNDVSNDSESESQSESESEAEADEGPSASGKGEGLPEDKYLRLRMRIARDLPLYSQRVCTEFPTLATLLSLYPTARKLLEHARKIERCTAKLRLVPENLSKVRAWLANPFSSSCSSTLAKTTGIQYKMVESTLQSSSLHLFLYDKYQVRAFVESIGPDDGVLTAQLETELRGLQGDPTWLEFPPEAREAAKKWHGRPEQAVAGTTSEHADGYGWSFVDAWTSGATGGGNNNRVDAWHHQSHYDRGTMCFLQTMHDDDNDNDEYDHDDDDNETTDDITTSGGRGGRGRRGGVFQQLLLSSTLKQVKQLDVGLLCASGRYAALAVAMVPPHVHFDICEYDGLETVRYR